MKYTNDAALPKVTDDMLKSALANIRPYTVCILKAGPRFQPAGPQREQWVAELVWQHGKRNYALRLAGLKRIICPIGDDSAISGISGISIFDVDEEETDRIMREDPGVKAGIFTYEVHATRTFPDSTLAGASEPNHAGS